MSTDLHVEEIWWSSAKARASCVDKLLYRHHAQEKKKKTDDVMLTSLCPHQKHANTPRHQPRSLILVNTMS